MTQTNPFRAPTSDLVAEQESAANLAQLARGQKLVIYAILVNIAAIVLRGALGSLIGVLGLATLVLSIMGILGIASALRFSTAWKVVLAICMLLPFVNLIVMLVLNSKATTALRAGGYKVGLLGASKPE